MTSSTSQHRRFVRDPEEVRARRRAGRTAGRAVDRAGDRATDRTGAFLPRQLTTLG